MKSMLQSLLLAVCILAALPASAQHLRIHGHPQKEFYASPLEWNVDSSQCHWKRGNLLPEPVPMFPLIPVGVSTSDPNIAHTHLNCNIPKYAELDGPIPVSCTIMLYHTDGSTSGIYSPLGQITDVVYEDTGTETPPMMVGDPMGVRQWNVHFTLDISRPRLSTFPPQYPTKHGWATSIVSTVTFYANGDSNRLDAVRSLYSVIDPGVPESPPSDEGLINGTRCSPTTLKRPDLNLYGNQMGVVVSEFVGLVPIAPIFGPWNTGGFFYSYASLEGIPGPLHPDPFAFPDGTFNLRRDLDIHNGIPGVTLQSDHFQGAGSFTKTPITLNPEDFGTGTHKTAVFWQQPDGQGNDSTALYVFDLTVGQGVPPPTLCTDPTAPNVGMPLPCLPPIVTSPPPVHVPVVTYLPFTPLLFERQSIDGVPQNVFKVCLSPNECFSFQASPIRQ